MKAEAPAGNSPLKLLDNLLGPINPLSHLFGTIRLILSTNYKAAADKHGPFGPPLAFLQAIFFPPVTKFGTPMRGKDATAANTLGNIIKLLNEFGITTMFYKHNDKELTFCVKNTQAQWAYHVLTNNGIKLSTAPANATEVNPLKANYKSWKSKLPSRKE